MNNLEKVKLVYHLLRDRLPADTWVKLAGLRLAKDIVDESRGGAGGVSRNFLTGCKNSLTTLHKFSLKMRVQNANRD